MGYLGNLYSMLEYQVSRRAKNPGSCLVSVATLSLFVWAYHRLAELYWPQFIKHYSGSKATLYVSILMGVTLLEHSINFLVYFIIDKYDLLPTYKITKDNLIWDTNPQKWRELRNRSIKYNIINIVCIGFMGVAVDSMFVPQSLFSSQVPAITTMLYQVGVCMVIESFLFYVFHKVGHLYLYRFHKVHHQFNVPTPLASNHFHPLDYFIGAIIPFAMGPKIFTKSGQFHIITLALWSIYRIGEGYDGHSNYEIPWSPFRALLLSTTSEYHSFHHTHNQGNFGSTYIPADTLFNDNSSFFKHKKALDSKNVKVQ